MQNRPSLLDELRTQYEAARQSVPDHGEVEGFQELDARMRKAFRWLEKGYQDRSICMQFTKQDPRLTPLHGDPRYEDLLRRLAFP